MDVPTGNTTTEGEQDVSTVSLPSQEEQVTAPLENALQGADDFDLDIDFDEIEQDLERFQEDETVQQALQRGVDLKKYGRELEKDLKEAEMESVGQYMENSQQVLDLHKQMTDCDAVLARMQEMLLGFQADLGGISEEIKYLQDESLSMSICLKNKKAAEEKLRYFLDNASISGEMADVIVNGPVNEAFLEAIVALSAKLRFLKSSKSKSDDIDPSQTYAGKALLPELGRLKLKAIVKSKDYFALQFNALRRPKTNVQMLQQNALVKYAPLFHFLHQEAPSFSDELKTAYIESMSRTISGLFKNYYSQLAKLEQVVAGKGDVIALEEATLKSMFSHKTKNKGNDAFALGDRDSLLDHIEDEPILVHVATAESKKYPYEAIFRSVLKHLVDSSCSEFLFLVDFFKSGASDNFSGIYSKTLSMILENLENFLLNSFDPVGLLLMIKISHAQHLVMQRRRIPVLDSFFDRMSLLLWPRLKFVLSANIKSLRSANVKKLGSFDMTPHYVTKRFAELVASLMKLQGSGGGLDGSGASTSSAGIVNMDIQVTALGSGVAGGGDNMLMGDLQQIREDYIILLEKLAQCIVGNKEQKVFLVNNLDLALSVFQERKLPITEEVQKLEDLLSHQRELFAEEEVKHSFPKLIGFVLQTEQARAAAAEKGVKFTLDEAQVEALVRDFASTWKTGIQQINDNVLAYFANFRNGMEILKQVLTQLLLYYTRFQDIVKKSFDRQPSFTRDIISTATILMEIKKYSRTF